MSDLAGRTPSMALGLVQRTAARPRAWCSPVTAAATGWSRWVAPAVEREPDVTLTADVVDWCLLVGDRIAPSRLA